MSSLLKILRKYLTLFLLLSVFYSVWAVVSIQLDPYGNEASAADFKLTISPADNPQNIPVYPNTKAYLLITYLFGTMDTSSIVCVGSTSCTTLMGTLFAMFNTGLVAIGALFLSYVIFVGSFVEASDGNAMSQKFASPYIPLRSTVGLGFLLPSATGYSMIQVIIVKIALLGSSAADTMWHYVLDYYSLSGAPIGTEAVNQSSSGELGVLAAQNFVKNMNEIAICNHYLNDPEVCPAATPSFSSSTPLNCNKLNSSFITTGLGGNSAIKTCNGSIVNGECQDGSSNICGSIQFNSVFDNRLENIIKVYMNQVSNIASQVVEHIMPEGNSVIAYNTLDPTLVENDKNQYIMIADAMQLDLEIYYKNLSNKGSTPSSSTNLATSEWLDIPQYFFSLLSQGSQPNYTVTLQPTLQPNSVWTTYSSGVENLTQDIQKICDFSSIPLPKNNAGLTVHFSGNSSAATHAFNNQLKKMFNATNIHDDALLGLASVGMYWFKIALDLLIAGFSFGLLVTALTGIAADLLSLQTFGFLTAFTGMVMSIFQTIAFLIPVASVFAIGLPMTPIFIFTAAIINWLVQVIVAITGAPMIALGMISSGQGLGRSNPALLLAVNLFLRPSLNVVGLIAAAKLFNLAYWFLTQAFVITVGDIMNSMGGDNTALMSIVSIVFLYAYTFMMSATCTRCYSMIYLLPDKVLTWIGAPAMASQEVQATMRTANKALQKIGSTGQKAGEDAMKGAIELFQEQAGKGKKKYQADDYKKKTLSDFAQGADSYFKTDIFSKTHSRGADIFSNITTSKTTRDAQQTINSVSKGDFESKIVDAQSTVATCEKVVQDAQTKTQQLEQEIAVANNDFKILPTAQKQINLDELNKDLLTSKATLTTAKNELKEAQISTSLLQKEAESGIALNKAILTSKKAELEKIPDATEREARAKSILNSVKETKALIRTYAMSIDSDLESKIGNAQSKVATLEQAVQDAQKEIKDFEVQVAGAKDDFKTQQTAQKLFDLDQLNQKLLTSKASLATNNTQLKEAQSNTADLQQQAESERALNKVILKSKKAELEKITDTTERESRAKNILKSVKETEKLIDTYAMDRPLDSKIKDAQSKVETLKKAVQDAQTKTQQLEQEIREAKGDSNLLAPYILTLLNKELLTSKATLATANSQLKEAQISTSLLQKKAESKSALNKAILTSKKEELEKIPDATEREARIQEILKEEGLMPQYASSFSSVLKGSPVAVARSKDQVLNEQIKAVERVRDGLTTLREKRTDGRFTVLKGLQLIDAELTAAVLTSQIHGSSKTFNNVASMAVGVLSFFPYGQSVTGISRSNLFASSLGSVVGNVAGSVSSFTDKVSKICLNFTDKVWRLNFKDKVSSAQRQAINQVRGDLEELREGRVNGESVRFKLYYAEIKAAVLARQTHGDSKTLNALASMAVGFVGIFNPVSGMTRMGSAYLFAGNLLGLGVALFNDIKAKPIKADGTIEWTMEEKALIFMTQVFTSKNAMMLASYGNQKLNELPEAIDKKIDNFYDVYKTKQWNELSISAKIGYTVARPLMLIPYISTKISKGIASSIAFTDEKTSSYLATRKANYAYLDAPENKTYSAKVAYAAGNAGRFIYNQGAPVIKGVGELIGGSLLIGLGAVGIGVGGGKLMARGASLMSGGAELLGQKLVVDVATTPIKLGTLAGSIPQYIDNQLAQSYSADKKLINLGINLLRSSILPVRLKEAGQWLNDSEKNKNANLGGYIHYESFEYRDVYSSNLTRKDKAFNIAVNTGLYFLKTPVFVAKGAGQVMIGGLQIATGNIGISGGDTGISMMGRGVLNVLSPIVTPIKTLHSIVDYGMTGSSYMYESTILPKQYYEFSDQINKDFEYRDVYSQLTLGKQAFNMAVNTGLYALKTPVFVAKGAVGLGVGATVTAVGLGGLILSGNDTMVNLGIGIMGKEALEIGKNTVVAPLTQIFYPNYYETFKRSKSADE